MQEYTADFLQRLIQNRDLINSFLERTTGEIFPTYYLAKEDEWYQLENNTLRSDSPGGTRVPKKDGLRENLIVWTADLDRALSILSIPERLCCLYYYGIYEKGRFKNVALAEQSLHKLVDFLNYGHLLESVYYEYA